MALKPEVILATSSDDRFPGSNCVDGKGHTFFLTSGGYPQEIILAFHGNSATISKIKIVSNGVKAVRIEKSVEAMPVKFEAVVEGVEFAAKDNGYQIEQFNVNKDTLGNIRYIKVIILSGYEQFSCINEIQIEGEEHDS